MSRSLAVDERLLPQETQVEVLSSKADWVQTRIPCQLEAVEPLRQYLSEYEADLPEEVRDALDYASREMIANAVEHGGKLDPSKQVEVCFIRLERSVVYGVKDPGEGFDPARLRHAATGKEEDDPVALMERRESLGMRPGGFGILMTRSLVDELTYNERGNELVFVKYFPAETACAA